MAVFLFTKFTILNNKYMRYKNKETKKYNYTNV